MKVLKYSLFERNDLDIIDNVNDLYERLASCISDAKNVIDVFVSGQELYVSLDNFITPIILCFSKNNTNYSFGRVEVGEEKVEMSCIWIPVPEDNPVEQITFRDLIIYFDRDRSSLKHELTHLYDFLKNKRRVEMGSESPDDYDESKFQKYFNIDLERNAYFIQCSIHIDRLLKEGSLDILDDFDTFMVYMKKGVGQLLFDNLNKKNKKKYLSRCYLLYQDFKNKYIK